MAERLEDILAEQLAVIFCGINPGVMAAAQGHHFAGRGNRFWRTLHLAGFTPQEVRAQNDRTILQYQCGLTAVVERPTARADQLSMHEFTAAAAAFEENHPLRASLCGVSRQGGVLRVIRSAGRCVGSQAQTFGNASVWVLPNPSGRNRAFTLEQLVDAYRQLNDAVGVDRVSAFQG